MSIRYTPRPEHRMTPEYTAYLNAQARCSGKRPDDFDDYAERGIKFLFTSFDQFYAEIGTKPSPEMLLDRIDNNGNYEPGNIQWTTPSKSNENKRLTKPRIEHLARISSLGGVSARNSGQAATIAHIRWHVNRGIIKENCVLCRIHQ